MVTGAGAWKRFPHTAFFHSRVTQLPQSNGSIPTAPGTMEVLKWLSKAAHRPALLTTYVSWLGTLCPCQTVTSCSQEPQVFSSTHSPLFPAGVTFSLPIPVKFWGGLGYLPRPASSEERTIPTWTFWDPWHRDQMGHYLFLMCLSGVSSGWWALTQDCVLGSWNNHTGYPGTWEMLGEGHDAKRSWWPLWGLRVGSRGP